MPRKQFLCRRDLLLTPAHLSLPLLSCRKTRRSKQKTLVLDLDETLVHSTLDGLECVPDFTFPVDVGPVRHSVAVRKRPHLHAFLERAAQLFEVVVFTASQRVYAEQLLDVIDPGRRLIRHRIYRESCVLWEGNYLKDLTVLGRDLAHTLIVDNSPQAFGFQLDNGVPIESWYDDDSDQELLRLLPFLEAVAHADDVRPAIRAHFQLRAVVDAAAEQQPRAP
jgi:CTD small phosphatase-like protein 2